MAAQSEEGDPDLLPMTHLNADPFNKTHQMILLQGYTRLLGDDIEPFIDLSGVA